MRTTVTLDNDVQQMLRDAMHRTGKSFKETLNAAVRAGLRPAYGRARRKRFVVKARAMGLDVGRDSLNKFADDFEVDAFLDKNRGRQK